MTFTPTEPLRFAGRRTSDAVIRRAIELAHIGWWQVNLRSTSDVMLSVPTWSDEAYRIFGYEPRSFEPTTELFFAQVPPEDRSALIAVIQQAVTAKGGEYALEHRIIRPDGTIRIVENRARVEVDAAGVPIRMVGTVLDLTDRRRMEEALRGRGGGSQLLTQIVEHSQEAIISAALDGVITTWNAAAERMFGWRAGEAIGRHLTAILPPERHGDVAAFSARLELGEAIGAAESVGLRRDGSRVEIALSLSPVADADGSIIGASAIVRDITQQKLIAAQLQRAQRLESVGHLAGGVAHEFNNLLMAITGYAELVLMELPEDSPARMDLRALLGSAERGARLTRQLLAFGRRQVLNPVALDLNAVLRDMEPILRPLATAGIALRVNLGAAPVFVLADRAQVEQVVLNLVTNARDAMPHGGELDIDSSVVEIGAGNPAPHPSIGPGRYARLAVRDTGIGMDADVQSRLFEPFYTTKPRGTNTGMGLATTYGIVKQSDGFITVESDPERGSTIRVFLPLHATPAP